MNISETVGVIKTAFSARYEDNHRVIAKRMACDRRLPAFGANGNSAPGSSSGTCVDGAVAVAQACLRVIDNSSIEQAPYCPLPNKFP